MRLVLMADHVFTDGANQLAILVELKQLRLPGSVALEGEKVSFRIDGYSRDTAGEAGGQSKRVSVCKIHIRLAQFMNDRVSSFSPGANGRVRARLRAII